MGRCLHKVVYPDVAGLYKGGRLNKLDKNKG